MVVVLIVAMALDKLPTNMIGPIAILVIFGNLFHFIGNKIPIVKSYLGGGSVFAIFASAAIATFGILPDEVVKSTQNFVSNMGFLDFYIAALITGSILGMNRKLLMKASVRFIPVALISMIVSFFAVGLVGMLIGNGFARDGWWCGSRSRSFINNLCARFRNRCLIDHFSFDPGNCYDKCFSNYWCCVSGSCGTIIAKIKW
jgi:Na+/citrate or Na+/malate symporter